MGRERAVLQPSHELTPGPLHHFRVLPPVGAPVDPGHAEVLHQGEIDRQFRDRAAREPHHQDASLPVDATHGLLEYVPAHGVEDHVRAASARERLDPIAKRLLPVVDDVVGAVRRRERQLLGGTGGGDHRGAHGTTHLDGGEPDAPGRAVHEEDLARREPSPALQPDVGSAVDDPEPGRRDEVQAVRNPDRIA